MKEKTKRLIVVGDPIKDCYITTQDKYTTKYEEREGGASNTYRNVLALLDNTDVIFYPNIYDNNYYRILRINNQQDIAMCAYYNKTNFYNICNLNKRNIEFLILKNSSQSGLVFSDYNKGVLNTRINIKTNIKYFRFSVSDTPFRLPCIFQECTRCLP